MTKESSPPAAQDGCIARVSALAIGYLVWLFGYFSIVLLFVQLPIGPFLIGTYLAAYGAATYLLLKGGVTTRTIKAFIVVLPGLLIFGLFDWLSSAEVSRGLAWLAKLPPHAMGVLVGIIISKKMAPGRQHAQG